MASPEFGLGWTCSTCLLVQLWQWLYKECSARKPKSSFFVAGLTFTNGGEKRKIVGYLCQDIQYYEG